MQLRPIVSPQRVGRKLLLLAQGGQRQHSAKRVKLAVVANGDHDLAIAAKEQFRGRRHRVGVAVAGRHPARHQVLDGQMAVQPDGGVKQRHVNALALSRHRAPVQRGQCSTDGVETRHHVRNGHRRAQRLATRHAVRGAIGAHQARHALRDGVIAWPRRIGAIHAKPRDRAVNERRRHKREVFVRQAVLLQSADFVVLYHHVAGHGDVAHDGSPLRRADVHGDRLLASVVGQEVSGIACGQAVAALQEGADRPRVISRFGSFDLDDGRPHVGKHLGRQRARHHPGQIQHAQSREGSGMCVHCLPITEC